MDPANDHPPLESRLPTTEDLLLLCRRLNEAGAKYLVLGGFALIQHGFARATQDIDILIDTSPENFAKVKSAMMGLPDGAIREVNAADFHECVVVRVGDEFVVGLMRQACGIDFAQASAHIVTMPVAGVPIPFASPRLLWLTKQTHRNKDAVDRAFLAALLKQRGEWP